MSGACGNCDCADKSQCGKNGNQIDIIKNENIHFDEMMMSEGGNCDKCKCGSGCACTDCTCCSH